MSKTLRLADALALPADEAATQKYGFIGRSGSGKSYGAMKMAELFLTAGAQIIALDWVGIWWSLRLSADGKRPGFEHVYIFGGEHADVDLRPESGALMADLVVDKHISVVLDVMHFRKSERTRFATAFAEQFFHRKKTARTACHLFIEEAQAYLPQMVRGDEARMVGVFEDIGKVGRNYGIGNSLISQRPQAINKDVLNQVEVLLAFQTNGPQERKAIAGWTAENTSAGAAMMQALPTLTVGDALVWSPQWLRIAERVHIAKRETYDSSKTPVGQAKSIAPKTLAKADLEQLGEEIKATIEKAKADDPRELKKRIAELEQQVKNPPKNLNAAAPVKAADKPVLTDADRELLQKVAGKLDSITDLARAKWVDAIEEVKRSVLEAVTVGHAEVIAARSGLVEAFNKSLDAKQLQKVFEKVRNVPTSAPSTRQPTRELSVPGGARTISAGPPRQAGRSSNGARPAVVADGELSKGERVVLTALAQYRGGLTREQLSVLCGYKKSTRDLYLQQLGRRQAIDVSGDVVIATPDGVNLLGDFEPLPTGQALVEVWRRRLPAGERAVLDVLVEANGQFVDRDVLSERTGYRKSTRDLYVQLLTRRKLATSGRDGVRASEALFE
jgi:hypothetical protein